MIRRSVVTVKTLIALSREGSEIELPPDALITPAARDWLRGARLKVRAAPDTKDPVGVPSLLYVVGDQRDSTVRAILPALERRHGQVSFLPCHGSLDGLLAAIGQVCAGLAACSRRRGVVLVADGAIACCVANRHPRVRAAIASRPSAVHELLRCLGVNLLIVESGRIALRQTQGIIGTFLEGKSELVPAVAAALAGAEKVTVPGGNETAPPPAVGELATTSACCGCQHRSSECVSSA